MFTLFRQRFWQPPRAHGDVIEDRTVSFLELFYDLVFVVVVAQAAHELAHHLTWGGVFDFVVVFGLIWFAWLNGTTYYDLHGREDGRTRTYVFGQMLLLALLAVFTADAAGEGGTGFALTYTAFLLLLTWMWFTVRQQDSEEYMTLTGRYLMGMAASVVVMGVSAALPDDARVIVWGHNLHTAAAPLDFEIPERPPLDGAQPMGFLLASRFRDSMVFPMAKAMDFLNQRRPKRSVNCKKDWRKPADLPKN